MLLVIFNINDKLNILNKDDDILTAEAAIIYIL
jgi:hypothetical protein